MRISQKEEEKLLALGAAKAMIQCFAWGAVPITDF
jgi:hypothetical protein